MSWLCELPAWGRRWPQAGTHEELTDILAVCGGNVCRAPYLVARAAHAAQVPEDTDYDDLDDPHGLDWPVYERMAAEADAALALLAQALREGGPG